MVNRISNFSTGVMKDVVTKDDFSSDDQEMTDMQNPNLHEVGRTDSFKMITAGKGANFSSNSLIRILSESSQGAGSELANNLIGGGLLGAGNSGRGGGMLDAMTPNGALNMSESPILLGSGS